MNTNNGTGESEPQDYAMANMGPEASTSMKAQDSNNSASAESHAQSGVGVPDLEVAVQQQLTEDEPQDLTEQPQLSSIAAPMLEKHESHPGFLAQEHAPNLSTQNHFGEPTPQLHGALLPAGLAVNTAHEVPTLHINSETDRNKSLPPGLGLHEVEHIATDASPISAIPSESTPPTVTPESLRGNPYRLSGSLTVANHDATETSDDGANSQAVEGEHNEQSAVAGNLVEGCETNQRGSSYDAPSKPEFLDRNSYHNERGHKSSDEEATYDEHDCGNDEDDRKFRQLLQSQNSPQFRGEQDLRMTLQDPRTGQGQYQPHIQGFGVSGYSQQNRPQFVQPRGFHEQNTRGYQGDPYDIRNPTGFQLFGVQASQMDGNIMRVPLHMRSAGQMMLGSYEDMTRDYQQYAPRGELATGSQDPLHAMQSYGQQPSASGYKCAAMSPQATQARASGPHAARQGPLKHVAMPSLPKTQQRGAKRLRIVNESDNTDDEEPLRTRVPRHPSVVSDSVIGSSPPAQNHSGHGKEQDEAEDSEPQVLSSKPKLGFTAPKGKKIAPKSATPAPELAQSQNAKRKESSSSSIGSIDWTLPKYEAQFEPGETKHDPTVAKVSIPGIVREELILSPDHAEQETHLLLHLFLPTQQALAIPESMPALAILNFHTVAVMVIEAFVQFEIGDEWGTGRGHWHNDHDQGDADYERQRDAKDADPDEIFFAVIDRWRAGSEANKQPSKLIRGVQEFCDIALDMIHYIREHGLLKERQRAVRKDKGVKRGAKKVGEDEEGEEEDQKEIKANKSVKRGAGKVNEPAVKKKAKVEAKAKPKAKAPVKRKRPSTTGVTVIRKA
jgi:hypothetical protein